MVHREADFDSLFLSSSLHYRLVDKLRLANLPLKARLLELSPAVLPLPHKLFNPFRMTERPVLLEDEPYKPNDTAFDDNDGLRSAMELKQASNSYDHLESLKVDDSQLVGKLTYDQLTLYEKKSVLVSSFS